MTLLQPSEPPHPDLSARDVRAEWRGLRLGAELEFFVVDRRTLRPRDRLDLLLEGMEEGSVKPEIAREHVELVTPPCTSLRELEEHARRLVRSAGTLLAAEGAVLLPLALWDTAPFTLTDIPRYRTLIRVFGAEFWRNACTILADQVNVGAENESQAFRIFGAVRAHLPLFVGLSAASPFRDGRANGVASNRMHRYDACTRRHPDLGGLPPPLRSMADYRRHLEEQPVLPHPNMFYRYARPMPHRGVAAEIRCIDKQPTLADFLALAALARAVAAEELAGDGGAAGPESARAAWTEGGRSSPDPPGADEGLAEAFRRARDGGPVDAPAWRERVEALSMHLAPADRAYLDPLRKTLDQGCPAVRLEAAVRERGMRSTLERLADDYLGEPVRAAG